MSAAFSSDEPCSSLTQPALRATAMRNATIARYARWMKPTALRMCASARASMLLALSSLRSFLTSLDASTWFCSR